jgi:hypothetical protein
MTVNRTTLLDLPLPVTGTESGTWGDTTNNGLTQYLDIAIAGSLVLSADSDTTLSSTEGDSSATNIGGTTAQYAVLRCTGARTATRNINAPAWAISGGTLTNYSKIYIVVNETTGSQNIVLRATNSATPTYTTGVTIVPGERAVCAWNGSDFVKVGGAAGGTNTQVQYNNNGVFGGVSGATTNGTAITFSTTNLKLQGSSTGVSSFASANSSASDYTYTFPAANTTIPVATQTLTFSGPTAARTITLPDANFTAARTDAAQTFTGVQTFSTAIATSSGGTGLGGASPFTANGVLYASSASALTSGSALTFDGSQIKVTAGPPTLVFNSTTNNSARGLLFENNGTQFARMTANFNNGDFRFVSGESGQSGYYFTWFVDGTRTMDLTSTGLGIGTSSPSSILDVQKAGTAAATTDLLELTNSGNAASMTNTGTGILFNQFYYDATTPAVADAGRIAVKTEGNWTSTGSTQDAYMTFETALDGTVAERARITSGGDLLVGTTSTSNLGTNTKFKVGVAASLGSVGGSGT